MRNIAILASSVLAISQAFMAETVMAQEAKRTTGEAELVDTIVVTGARSSTVSNDEIVPHEQVGLPADATAIAARTPGGALVGNGALSGQLSYRGLAGERVLGRINGQAFATGGPNAMDPPLHYAPAILVERLDIARGVAPASGGPALAGAVNAQLIETAFSDGPQLAPQVRLASQYRTVDNSYAIGGLAGLANDTFRIGVIASREEGDDYEIPDGKATGTSFERNLYGVHAGLRTGPGELYVEYRRSETDPSGNPPFALDIVYFNTDFVQAGFRGEIADEVQLDARLGHVAIRHLMDNLTLRQPPASAAQARATFAEADTTTADVSVKFGTPQSYIQIGAGVALTDKATRITNPTNPGFFIDSLPDVSSERIGAFAQMRGAIDAVEYEIGARVDRTSYSAGIPQLGAAVPAGPRILAAQFVAADRDRSDTTVDAVLRAWLPAGAITPRLTLARKERVPSLLERYGWLPTEASFGLADGNIYVGNLDLRPETAWIAELGFDYDSDVFSIRPTLFYRRVDDFIQGVPVDATVGIIDSPVEMVAGANGDTTPLRFANVDVELYGIDFDFSLRPIDRLELSGTASYVRGKRRDINDDLYRVAPANLRLSAQWLGDNYSFGVEVFAEAEQNRVSVSNGEQTTGSYAVAEVFGRYVVSERLTIEAGIENLFDTRYEAHLSGRNRVAGSDVALGEKLPGAGRGGWVRLTSRF